MITIDNKNSSELNFEDEQNISNSYYIVRAEYLKKRIKKLVYLIPVIIILIIHFTVIYPFYLIPDNDIGISTLQPSSFSFTINWTLFSIGTYLIFYLIEFTLMKITPSLKKYIQNEINNLGYKIYNRKRSWISFLILNSLSVLLLFLVELRVIFFYDPSLNTFFKGVLIFYLIIAIFIPILWRFSHEGLVVKLKNKYQVYINPYYRIQKSKVKDYQLIGIYLTSNRIALRLNKNKKELYIEIAKTRWLVTKKKSLLFKYNLSPFLKFNEFSTPSNFQKQFLNIILALQEWDVKTKRLFN